MDDTLKMEGYKHCAMDFLELMDKLNEEMTGDIFIQNNKVKEQEIEFFQNWLIKYYKKDCSEYIEFIKTINGFVFDGTIIYSLNEGCSDNIFKWNEAFWNENEKLREYIIFAHDPLSLYGLNIKNEKYYALNGWNGNVMDEYKTFYDLLLRVLEERWLLPKIEQETIVGGL